MALPGSSSFPAEYPEKQTEADSVGDYMRNLLEKNILPRDIMTRAAFENAMVCAVCTTTADSASGPYHGSRWFHQRGPAFDRYGSLCRHLSHHRRLPECLRSSSIPCGSEAKWKVCYGGYQQDRRYSQRHSLPHQIGYHDWRRNDCDWTHTRGELRPMDVKVRQQVGRSRRNPNTSKPN